LFAASLPIAPLIALMTILIDIRIDAKRLLWLYRRPVPFIAQDIGKNLLTYLCCLSFLISSNFHYGDLYSASSRLLLRSTADPCMAKSLKRTVLKLE